MADTVIVVPCYNESQRLDRETFLRFALAHTDIRLTFVDDGSRDATRRKLLELQAQAPGRIDVVALPENQGKAEAVRQGILHAVRSSAKIVGFWDADLATPLELIPVMRDVFVRRADVAMVFGSRVPLLGRRIHRKPSRRLLGRLFAWTASKLMGVRIFDTQCGAKMFRVTAEMPDVFAHRFTSRWVFDVEILARWLTASKRGMSDCDAIYELPVDDWRDIAGSRLKTRDFVRGAADLLQIAWNYRLGRNLDGTAEKEVPTQTDVLPMPSAATSKKLRESQAA